MRNISVEKKFLETMRVFEELCGNVNNLFLYRTFHELMSLRAAALPGTARQGRCDLRRRGNLLIELKYLIEQEIASG